jgi:hypothetical protein
VRFSVCLIVRDEAAVIGRCLAPLVAACDDIVVLDTGSVDGTAGQIEREHGLRVHRRPVPPGVFSMADARNAAIELARHDWIVQLDADELLLPAALERLLALPATPPGASGPAGWFVPWITQCSGMPVVVDYKCLLFRRCVRSTGRVHEHPTWSLRAQGLTAHWLDGVQLLHYPEPARVAKKREGYRRALAQGIAAEPHWIRYWWFAGYSAWMAGEPHAAQPLLEHAAASASREFPVECLNSSLVLAHLHARAGRAAQTLAVIERARAFLAVVADDFEVQVNAGVSPWLEEAAAACRAGLLAKIEAPLFQY